MQKLRFSTGKKRQSIRYNAENLSEFVQVYADWFGRPAVFLTLTAPSSPKKKIPLEQQNKRVKRAFYFWKKLMSEYFGSRMFEDYLQKVELQRRGVFHYHLLILDWHMEKREWGIVRYLWVKALKRYGLASRKDVILAERYAKAMLRNQKDRWELGRRLSIGLMKFERVNRKGITGYLVKYMSKKEKGSFETGVKISGFGVFSNLVLLDQSLKFISRFGYIGEWSFPELWEFVKMYVETKKNISSKVALEKFAEVVISVVVKGRKYKESGFRLSPLDIQKEERVQIIREKIIWENVKARARKKPYMFAEYTKKAVIRYIEGHLRMIVGEYLQNYVIIPWNEEKGWHIIYWLPLSEEWRAQEVAYNFAVAFSELRRAISRARKLQNSLKIQRLGCSIVKYSFIPRAVAVDMPKFYSDTVLSWVMSGVISGLEGLLKKYRKIKSWKTLSDLQTAGIPVVLESGRYRVEIDERGEIEFFGEVPAKFYSEGEREIWFIK